MGVIREFFTDIPDGGDMAAVVLPILESTDEIPTQKVLVAKQDAAKHQTLLNSLKASDPLKASWLSSASTKGISSWLYIASNPLQGISISEECLSR
jgi:hypothetical protein